MRDETGPDPVPRASRRRGAIPDGNPGWMAVRGPAEVASRTPSMAGRAIQRLAQEALMVLALAAVLGATVMVAWLAAA